MNLMDAGKRWVVPLLICSIVLMFISWRWMASDSREFAMPPVTEESLSPEQKAQLEQLRQVQADLMRQAGGDPQAVVSPQEFAQQQLEQVQSEQAAEQGAAEAGGGGR